MQRILLQRLLCYYVYIHTFTDPSFAQVGLNLEFVMERGNSNMQSSQSNKLQNYIKFVET